MARELLPIYGPFAINTYGTIIAIALLIFLWLMHSHPKKRTDFPGADLVHLLTIGIFLGLAGGRLLYILSNIHSIKNPLDIIDVWNGGFSVLGSILSVLIGLPFFLKRSDIPVIPFFDFIAIHAALLQSISRFGCFFAGCCYGKPFTAWWSVIYHNPDTFAPLHCWLHPTQLYSAFILFLIFCFMYCIAQKKYTKNGQLISIYLLLISVERFAVDFLRADQEFFSSSYLYIFSINQWISLGIASMSLCALFYFSVIHKLYSRLSYQ